MRQALVPFARRIATGYWKTAGSRLLGDGRTILQDRLWPFETKQFHDKLCEVRASRSALFLQADLARANRLFRMTIARQGLTSKQAFARFCEEQGFPHPPAIAYRTGQADFLVPVEFGDELFVKRDQGSSGRGSAILRRLESGLWRMTGESGVSEGTPASLLAQMGRRSAWLVQPLLRNAPSLALPHNMPLATFRIVTGYRPGTGARAICGLVQLPRDCDEPIASRWAQLPINPETCLCASLAPNGLAGASSEADARIHNWTGRQLEETAHLFALAREAHERLVALAPRPLPSMIGWDAVLSDRGPLLLELNWNWGVAVHYCNAAGFDPALSAIFAGFAGTGTGRD